jgi:RNA polymerase sigma factor (sigma-70 family)
VASHPLQDFIRRLRRARSVTEGGHLSDAQLLERFAKERDEAAFEVLVWRHGTLVLNVARRLLRHAADAEDVFQATFLTLARKAAAIRRGTSVGSWLYKVAYRLALRARQAAARRERRQHSGLDHVAAPAEHGDAELDAVLAEEVNRLPERCRAVVVLCYLQGATTEEAAHVLGCPRGTVLSRLASARQRLRQRLVRRGIAPAAALAAVSFSETASAGPSAALVAGVVAAALPFAAGGAVVPMVSPQAAALAQGALQAMMWTKIKIVTVMACMMAVVGTGSGWLAHSYSAGEASPPAAEPPVKKNGLPEATSHLKEIDKIHEEMAELDARENMAERRLCERLVQARLQLLEAQDEMKWLEEMYQSSREELREKCKEIRSEITRQENIIEGFARKGVSTAEQSALYDAKGRKKYLEAQIKASEEKDAQFFRTLRDKRNAGRKSMVQAEEEVRLLEVGRARQREDFAAQRERMQARLQRLEDKGLDLEPADRLRDVERKLDTLRRDVGELRRVWERQEKESRKKP